jgi:hypothetical protein
MSRSCRTVAAQLAHLALMLAAHPIFSVADGFAKASPTTSVCLLAKLCCLMTASSLAVSMTGSRAGAGLGKQLRLALAAFLRETLFV